MNHSNSQNFLKSDNFCDWDMSDIYLMSIKRIDMVDERWVEYNTQINTLLRVIWQKIILYKLEHHKILGQNSVFMTTHWIKKPFLNMFL